MKLPEIPRDREIFETELATYWWADEGFLVSNSKSILRTVDNLNANSEVIKQITNNTPAPLLIYLADSPMPDKPARELSNILLPQNYSCMAMISKPGLGAFIMKLLFSIKKSPIPLKTFTEEQEAIDWLLAEMKKRQNA